MKQFFISFIALLSTVPVCAQHVKGEVDKQTEDIALPEGMLSETDSLYLDWISKNYIKLGENCVGEKSSPYVNDSVYMERLQRIPAVIEMPYNAEVRKYIDMYTTRLRQKVAFMLSANNFYMDIFEEALDLYNLPLELKYLPVIESGLNPMAASRQGAVGLWQFMLRTGKAYGLQSNSLVDERRDPVKSTRAAARYLKELYDIYHDWNLVLAAYNCGPGTINKAIRRADGEKDFWKLYNFLPRETRSYVPAFIAANYIMTYYCEHNISPMDMRMPEGTDTIHISRPLHLKQVAEVCKINIEQLRALNPEFKTDVIPGNIQTYALRLPNDKVSFFLEQEDSIYQYKQEVYNARRKSVAVPSASSSGKVYYKVRRGDTLGRIASKYGVSVNQIKRLNGLKGTNIQVGKSLRVR